MATPPSPQEVAQKKFDQDDRKWNGPKLVGLGAFTLAVALSVIYLMSTSTGCSLQIVP